MASTAAAPPDLPSGAYRETFLVYLEPARATAFRARGRRLLSRLFDREPWGAGRASLIEGGLRGAAADLRFLAEHLRSVGWAGCELGSRDWLLAYEAGRVAPGVAEIARQLAEALERPWPPRPPREVAADGE